MAGENCVDRRVKVEHFPLETRSLHVAERMQVAAFSSTTGSRVSHVSA
jgi:hypothetical protein